MNEIFSADPSLFESSGDMRELLSRSGPEFGRYVIRYPSNWASLIQDKIKLSGDLEAERIKALLRRGKEELRLIADPSIQYDENLDWTENICTLFSRDSKIDFAVADENAQIPPEFKVPWSDYSFLSVSQENIETRPSEFARVCKTLCKMSHEIYILDPYLDPSLRNHASVLLKLLEVMSQGKCRKLTIIAREDKNKRGGDSTIKSSMTELLNRFKWLNGFEFHLNLYDDNDLIDSNTIHDRYLFSVKGGISVGNGFQELKKPARSGHQSRLATPLCRSMVNLLVDRFHEGNHKMKLMRKISIST